MQKFALHIDPGNPKPAGFKPGSGFVTSIKPRPSAADEKNDD